MENTKTKKQILKSYVYYCSCGYEVEVFTDSENQTKNMLCRKCGEKLIQNLA